MMEKLSFCLPIEKLVVSLHKYLKDGNVLMGDDGHLYFIDTIIYPSDTNVLDTY